MPWCCSMALAGIRQAASSMCRTISACSSCRPIRLNSIRSRMSGNICARTSSAIASSTATMTSSTPAAMLGTHSPPNQAESDQSLLAPGHRLISNAVGISPISGGHVMQTIGASMQMLRAGETTKAHRHTGSFIYQVAKGCGHSIVGGKRFDWQERDIFCVPSWAWHEHANASASEDACLFAFNDLPVIESLGLYREETYGDNAGHQPAMP